MAKKINFKMLFILFTLIGSILSITLYFTGRSGIKTEEINFNSYDASVSMDPNGWIEDDSIQLNAREYFPRNFDELKKYPTVIMFHGYGRDLEDNDYFARNLADMGIYILSISSRGHGESTGEYPLQGNFTFPDAYATYKYVIELDYVDIDRIIAHGTSMGGAQSIFLAVHDFVPNFVVWFPATGYISSNKPLANYTSTNPKFEGIIFAGTADECGYCVPEFNTRFADNNEPNIELVWHEGAIHTDVRFYMENLQSSIQWISDFWEIPEQSLVSYLYSSGILAGILGGTILLIDVIFLIMLKIHSKNKKKEINL